MSTETLPQLARTGHAAHCNLCLTALPPTQAEADPSRTALGFYCLGTLDLLGSLDSSTVQSHRTEWIEWLWQQQSSGKYGTGFTPSPFMNVDPHPVHGIRTYSEYDTPHLIMTYTAILSLAILRDDFSNLDRKGLVKFIRSCQRDDGSFASLPNDDGDSDLRQVYCAFAICSMLDDWSGMDVDLAVAYIKRCFSYEGGFGQSPHGEALGGTTYCALASLSLAPHSSTPSVSPHLTPSEKAKTIKWLVQNQTHEGGFCGRTNKLADACYCFWCGASLHILGAGELVDRTALSTFLSKCQFKFGGLSKQPHARPDPYHTYMSLAALSISPPDADDTWKLPPLDPIWNVTTETAQWIKYHVPERS